MTAGSAPARPSESGGASERAELDADSIIGLRADDAIDVARGEGFEIRDNTDADLMSSDVNPDCVNIWLVDGNGGPPDRPVNFA